MKRFRDSGYMVTKDGRIFNKHGKEKEVQHVNGYPQMMLYINCQMRFYYVHRIVAELYVPNPDGYKFVKHKDGNRFNNHASNLEWAPLLVDRNQRKRNYKCDISDSDVQSIRLKYEQGIKQQILAEEYNVSQSYISHLVNNINRKIKTPTL